MLWWCDFIDQHFFYVTDSFLTWTKMLEFYYEHFFELLILSYLKHNINKRQRKKEICTQRRNFLSKIKKNCLPIYFVSVHQSLQLMDLLKHSMKK